MTKPRTLPLNDANERVLKRVKNRTRARGEEEIHKRVVAALRAAGVCFFHVPNASKATPSYRGLLASLGLSAGIPDLIIIDRPPLCHGYVGAVLELKTKAGRASEAQLAWIDKFRDRGWAWSVSHGLDAALQQLRAWGYIR